MNRHPRSIAFLLPNFFTASSIFAGVYSMVSAVEGRFELAAWMIFVSLVFDGLDGRVARLTNTCSRFGVEFDSLADIVAFGTAPALLLYLYTGHDFGRLGILASAIYVVFGAIRLARFNVMTSQVEPSVFIGVPIPTAAAFTAVSILLFEKYPQFDGYHGLLIASTVAVALLMVSNIRYPSFKKVNVEVMNIKRLLVTLLVAASLLFLYPIEGFVGLFALYLLYGPVRAGWFFYRRYTLLRRYKHRHRKK
jgi:CDP-diacylglycerol--serine O-phosphatidyltransferase